MYAIGPAQDHEAVANCRAPLPRMVEYVTVFIAKGFTQLPRGKIRMLRLNLADISSIVDTQTPYAAHFADNLVTELTFANRFH